MPATGAVIRVKQTLIIPVAIQNILKLSKASSGFQKLMITFTFRGTHTASLLLASSARAAELPGIAHFSASHAVSVWM